MNKGCLGCQSVLEGNTLTLSNYEGLELTIESMPEIKLHMTDGFHHTTRDIFYCPFCGNKLTK